MNFETNSSKHNEVIQDVDIFDDSSFLNNFQESSFQEAVAGHSKSLNRSALNVSALCCDEEISGYDKLTGQTWIYPTNYPVRDYQFNIIKTALLKNTLVSLPTGLGKTFIAAVIMYNFYRWYPLGKIVFTAPTRPLVAQQIDACYNIIAIPPEDTVEMTGTMNVNTRKTNWISKRVFFATPQVIYNDVKAGVCPADLIRCLVFDEAHRARGNYSYCQIMGALSDMGHKTFRILALSATPGSKVEDVANVVKSLHIAHLELRTENCIDVAPYSHTRKINTVIIQLGPELTHLRQQYVEILDNYARRLKQLNILPQNVGNLSKGRVVMLYKEFQTKDRGSRHPQHNWIMKDFTVLIALYHGLELLVKHGSRVFLNFFDEHPEKSWIQGDDNLTVLLERLRDDLGINPLALDRSILPDGTMPEIPKDICFGHPKFDKLKEIMLTHFQKAKENGYETKAIVFCEYRESVHLVHCLLLQCRPLISAMMFVGQGGSGKEGRALVSQKQQLRVMRAFREGAANALVCTCVAEEGLDVGAVDLIICFDISTRSPVRLVQRCGRTGRKRSGQVHILVTEGREHQTLLDCMRQRDGLNKKVLQSKEVQSNLYALNPRMMPHDFTPTCQKMFITVKKNVSKTDGKESVKTRKGQKDLRTMLLGQSSSGTSGGSNTSANYEERGLITKENFNQLFPQGFPDKYEDNDKVEEYWAMSKDSLLKMSRSEPKARDLSTWIEWQRSLQKTINVGHSRDSEILSELLQLTDAKRFELPVSTQNPCFNTQNFLSQNTVNPTIPPKPSTPVKSKVVKKKPKPVAKSPSRKDGDIRALFNTATKSTKNYTKLINDLGIPRDGSIPNALIDILVDMSVENNKELTKCYICLNICDCTFLKNIKKESLPTRSLLMNVLKKPNLPDLGLFDDINVASIEKFVHKDEIETKTREYNKTAIQINKSSNFDLDFDFESQEIEKPEEVYVKTEDNVDTNFDIGDIDDIFVDSSPEEGIVQHLDKKSDENANIKENDALGFFGLDSIEDIFAYSDDDNCQTNVENKNVNKSNDSREVSPIIFTQKTNKKELTLQSSDFLRPASPSLLSGNYKTNIPTSPILSSQVRKLKFNDHGVKNSTPISKLDKSLGKVFEKSEDVVFSNNTKSVKETSVANTSEKSMFTITQLVEMINKTDHDKSKPEDTTKVEHTITKEEERLLADILNETARSNSPILLTQSDKKKSFSLKRNSNSQIRKGDSLIILDSDSDSDDTQEYQVDTHKKSNEVIALDESFKSPSPTKSKLNTSEQKTASPYFSQKAKTEDSPIKPLSLQQKIIKALTNDKSAKVYKEDRILFTQSSPVITSGKENLFPVKICSKKPDSPTVKKLESLQMFRHDPRTPFSENTQKKNLVNVKQGTQKRKIEFDDSDDDFVIDDKTRPARTTSKDKPSIVNHKIRKKQKKNSFLELEAELSGSGSGDELSDESVGSIIDFICDEQEEQSDMTALYLNSVKSSVNGMFKIPNLPKKYDDAEIFSQYVEEDAYEMDSFCVDSHIELTQAHDVSELELAEQLLEKKRKAKRKFNDTDLSPNKESPLVKRKNRIVKRRISSDSDD